MPAQLSPISNDLFEMYPNESGHVRIEDSHFSIISDQGAREKRAFIEDSTFRNLRRAASSQTAPGLLEDYFAWVYSLVKPRTARGPEAVESSEMRWLVEHSRELEIFRGEWLLIRGERLIAHSPTFAEVERNVRALRLESPFVYYVPLEDEANFTS
jgi:hypothetical protein